MRIEISKLENLTQEEIKRDFEYHGSKNGASGFYFAEVIYNKYKKHIDLYIKTTQNKISNDKIEILNQLNKNIKHHNKTVDSYILSTLSNHESRKKIELSNIKLNIDIIEIQDGNINYDTIIICGKQYKYFGFLKKDVSIRIEIKSGKIISMVRKKDVTKKNKSS